MPVTRHKTLKISVIALAVSQLFSVSAFAKQTEAQRIAELEKKLEQSSKLIEQLSARLNSLEKKAETPVAAAPAAPATPIVAQPDPAQLARIEAVERSVTQITEASARTPENAGLPIHGFADVGYVNSGKSAADGRKSGFVLGNVDFYLSPEFGDRVKSLIELNFEYGDSGSLGTDLERLQLGYTVSDSLTLWAGRFHTPYGYWSTAFHHGAQIQTSIDRPKMIAFEDGGGILPAHTVGLWATGKTKVADGSVEYDAYVGNGNRILDGVIDYNAVKDDNSDKFVGGSVRYRFGGALDGLLVGAHAFKQEVSSYVGGNSAPSSTTSVNMFGGYGFYDADGWENIAEFYRFNNSSGGTSRNSWSGFVQVGHNFEGNLTPYVRYEKASLNQLDPYFANLEQGKSYARSTAGIRYDLSAKTALKFEVNQTDETVNGGEKYNEAKLQFSVRF